MLKVAVFFAFMAVASARPQLITAGPSFLSYPGGQYALAGGQPIRAINIAQAAPLQFAQAPAQIQLAAAPAPVRLVAAQAPIRLVAAQAPAPIRAVAVASPARIQPQPEPFDPNPQYTYSYSVNDALTGDSKTATETRDGDKVTGSYSLVEPDGGVRTVTYTADDVNGFNAVVDRTPPRAPVAVAAPAQVAVRPVVARPAQVISPTVIQVAQQPAPQYQIVQQSAPQYQLVQQSAPQYQLVQQPGLQLQLVQQPQFATSASSLQLAGGQILLQGR